ncbi:MAG: hypothetical protein QM743_11005 [Chitinophagaceae bacterium]
MVVTFLGGPLAGGYLIAENFRTFGEPQKARITWAITIIAALLLMIAFSCDSEQAQRMRGFIGFVCAFIAHYITQYLQGKQIDAHIESGGSAFGWGRVIAIGLISLLMNAGVYILSGCMQDS